jgi:hypothetical protein
MRCCCLTEGTLVASTGGGFFSRYASTEGNWPEPDLTTFSPLGTEGMGLLGRLLGMGMVGVQSFASLHNKDGARSLFLSLFL